MKSSYCAGSARKKSAQSDDNVDAVAGEICYFVSNDLVHKVLKEL